MARKKKTAGQMIKDRRQDMRLTQAQAAERIGMTQAQWASIEADRRSPTLDTLERVAKSLKCKTRDLVP